MVLIIGLIWYGCIICNIIMQIVLQDDLNLAYDFIMKYWIYVFLFAPVCTINFIWCIMVTIFVKVLDRILVGKY